MLQPDQITELRADQLAKGVDDAAPNSCPNSGVPSRMIGVRPSSDSSVQQVACSS